jgi:hypothetical protein
VRGISWLGGVAKEPAGPGHREGLLAAGRCPRCAERFRGRECPCGERAFASDEHGAAYLRALDGRFVRLLPVAALCGLLPAVGVVPVLLLVRFGLLSPARRYLPLTTGFVLRWGVRFVNLGLVLVQGLPLLGILALPLLVTVDWAVYRRALRGAIAR